MLSGDIPAYFFVYIPRAACDMHKLSGHQQNVLPSDDPNIRYIEKHFNVQ